MVSLTASLEQLRHAGLADVDPEIANLLGRELERQRSQIELIASENFTWPSVLEALGSVPTNKYAEGYPGKRYYGGCEVVDEIEQLAIDRAKSLFGAEHANVQPHAGAQANMAAYFALLAAGRHDPLASARSRRSSDARPQGQLLRPALHDRPLRRLARDRRRRLRRGARAREGAPAEADRLRRLGVSTHRRHGRVPEIADEVDALLMCDMAHFSGLVAAGLHPNPVEHCDVVTSTTHKTLAGPRAGFVLCREEHAQAVDRAVFPGMQGGPLEHAIAAKAACFRIAATEAFREYQTQVRANADALADELLAGGLDVLTGGTDTHLLQLDLRGTEWTGKDAEERLDEVKLTVNRNTVPFDERPPTIASGVRIGTPAATMRGFDEDDFREVGSVIVAALADGRGRRRAGRALRCAVREATALPGFPRLRELRVSSVAAAASVTEVKHPLVQHKLGLLRDVSTDTQMFRQLVNELTLLLTYEATKDLATEDRSRSRRRSSGRRRSTSPARRSPSARSCARAWGCSTACSR